MTNDTSALGATRHQIKVEKYNNLRVPGDGDPDEIVLVDVWIESDGSLITDSKRIRELEESTLEET